MKTLTNVLKLLALFAIVGCVIFFADYCAQKFRLSGFSQTLVATLGLAPFAYLWLDTSQLVRTKRLSPGSIRRVILVRALASVVIGVGVFLVLGNVLHLYPTFSYAGSLVAVAGVMVYVLGGNA